MWCPWPNSWVNPRLNPLPGWAGVALLRWHLMETWPLCCDTAVLFQWKWNAFDKITNAWQSTVKLCKGENRRGKKILYKQQNNTALSNLSNLLLLVCLCVFYWQNKINWISSHTITCSFLPHTNCLANWCLLNFLHFIEWLGTKLTVDICRRLTGICNYC